jgi:uncharacterized protein
MMDDTAPTRRCPICGKPTVAQHRPFCSRRCAIIDLGRWLKEDYRVPAAEDPKGTAEDDPEA